MKLKDIDRHMKTKLFSVVGRSGSGKTTLITKLLPLFVDLGLKVGSIKHTHHDVTLDKPGKDSWQHGQSGSERVMLITNNRMALYSDFSPDTSLQEICREWFQGFDLVISEGFKNQDGLKIEVTRQENNRTPLYSDPNYNIQAIVSDYPIEIGLPVFALDEPEVLFNWLCKELKIQQSPS